MLTVNEDRKHVLGEKPTVDEVAAWIESVDCG